MLINSNLKKGKVAVPGGDIWYKIVGTSDKTPLITIHGGPGTPHDYLQPLRDLSNERPVIFYDQLGCGKSSKPADLSLWQLDRFITEFTLLVDQLPFDRLHIYGHSWGTIIAVEYALRYAHKTASLILASPCLDMLRWKDDTTQQRNQLPIDIKNILESHELAKTTDSDEYLMATMEYYKRHICRKNNWPEPMLLSMQGANNSVYQTIWGINEFTVTGNIATYNCTDRLSEIIVPVLLTCGRYDEATPTTTNYYASLLTNAEVAIFENSGHVPHLEEEELYIKTLRQFLDR